MCQRRQTIGKIIDKAKGKIRQAVGDLAGNKVSREVERDECKVKTKAR
jgi:uncharacterized protein YjbJ (UPF0337 family)